MSGTSIRIRGREYKVEKVLDPELKFKTRGPVYYRLVGVRGAQHFTLRNANTPHLMFLMTERWATAAGNGVMDGVWLSDASGELVVVSQ